METNPVLGWLIISQGLALVSLLPWLMFAGRSFTAFDTPGAARDLKTWLFVLPIWLYPPFVIGLAVLAWYFYINDATTSALIATSVPLVLVVPLILYFLVIRLILRK